MAAAAPINPAAISVSMRAAHRRLFRMWPGAQQAVTDVDRGAGDAPRKACPNATCGGRLLHPHACRVEHIGRDRRVPRNTSSASRASPRVPLTWMSSPACAPERSSAWPCGTSPKTVIQMLSGPRVVSPPTSSQSWASASAQQAPRERLQPGLVGKRIARPAESQRPGAAGGEVAQVHRQRLVASLNGSTVDRKWRPSTSMSQEHRSCMPAPGDSSAPVIADAQCVARHRALEVAVDQVEFTMGGLSLGSPTALARRQRRRSPARAQWSTRLLPSSSTNGGTSTSKRCPSSPRRRKLPACPGGGAQPAAAVTGTIHRVEQRLVADHAQP